MCLPWIVFFGLIFCGSSDFCVDKIEPSPLRGEGRERVGRGCLMNDFHKHFIAKALRKDFTDTGRLLGK